MEYVKTCEAFTNNNNNIALTTVMLLSYERKWKLLFGNLQYVFAEYISTRVHVCYIIISENYMFT